MSNCQGQSPIEVGEWLCRITGGLSGRSVGRTKRSSAQVCCCWRMRRPRGSPLELGGGPAHLAVSAQALREKAVWSRQALRGLWWPPSGEQQVRRSARSPETRGPLGEAGFWHANAPARRPGREALWPQGSRLSGVLGGGTRTLRVVCKERALHSDAAGIVWKRKSLRGWVSLIYCLLTSRIICTGQVVRTFSKNNLYRAGGAYL